jgi:hypothetical protein
LLLSSIFKEDASQAAIDAHIIEVEKAGGTITQKYDSSIMRGFAAKLPEEKAREYEVAVQGGKHEHM